MLNNRKVFSHSSGSWNSEIKAAVWLGSGETYLPGLQVTTVSLHHPKAFPQCVCQERERSSSSSKATNPIRLGPQPYTFVELESLP